MKKASRSLLLLSLSLLCAQPMQAAASFVEGAAMGGVFYAGIAGAAYAFMRRNPDQVEAQLQRDPAIYKVTDASVTGLIQQEAQKRGLDFSKFIVVKNNVPTISVGSYPGNEKIVFNIGSDQTLKEFSEMDAGAKKGTIQHELNHIVYNHTAKSFGVTILSNYAGYLTCCATLSFVASYIEKKSGQNSKIAYWMRGLCPLISVGCGYYAGKKSAPLYSRYCEKQADLAIDDDPAVINGFMEDLQCYYDRIVKVYGEAWIKRDPELFFGAGHPTPLERIAYLREKLKKCPGYQD